MKNVNIINRHGEPIAGRRIEITRDFDVSIDQFWKNLQQVESLIEICKPLIYFTGYSENLPSKWDIGKEYRFNLFMFRIFPAIKHSISLVKIDPNSFEIISQEHNIFIPTWNHIIKMEKLEDDKTRYTDIIDIHARGITYLITLGAVCFYKHRQRKWRKLHKHQTI